MTIKYGDLTIVWHPVQSWMSCVKGELHQYIFLFDDHEICEVKDKYIDFKFKFLRINNDLPAYFEKPTEKLPIYFIQNEPNFDKLFSVYSNEACIKSKYNGIYFSYQDRKYDMFGIQRIKSTESMPRYQFAYNTNEFTKEEVIYLLYSIIKS